ncbi:F-box domain-containing protein [Dioscorea alata]|uniref:F-box domain-containing protein n=1 Tax=Dioscorea alata TaxID=55571 RepID=A0ACB7U7P1_DIOAL|nr:F-box domain-containing protein [Dioscorea alata]
MGSLLSLPSNSNMAAEHGGASQVEACKRMRMSSGHYDEYPRLIPCLPDEISLQILARLPRIQYLNVKLVSRSWKAAITNSEVFQLRKELGTTEEWLYVLTKTEDKLVWHAFEPRSGKWQRLPPMPNVVHEEEPKRGLSGFWMWNIIGSSLKIGDVIRSWLGRRDALDRLPYCGCAIGAVDGCLYVLGGFSKTSTMKCVWQYDPCTNLWQEVNSMSTGRAFCKTGLLNNKLYVVGGVNKIRRGGLTPLRSAEVYDPQTGLWTEVANMPFSKAHSLPTAFLAEMLKPIATGLTSYQGKLCVPQSLYSWPFFVDVGGEVYDPETSSWTEMPVGMGEGWPARQAGTKLSVVVDGELYALEPSSTLDSGKIKMYDHQEDAWKVVIRKVPVCDFTDSESPYLLANFLGKLHVITKDANNGTAILQANLQKPMQYAPSTSSSSSVDSSDSSTDAESDAENDVWKAIATKNFGAAELVGCQVLDV